jgi:inositol transport system substrate-binding protein
VIANNDEMALGAIQAMKAAGAPVKDVVVAGIDAMPDALAAMGRGELAVTVFQDGASQGVGGLDAALDIIKGKPVAKKVFTKLELVTPETMGQYVKK